jgi:hypothetical protein
MRTEGKYAWKADRRRRQRGTALMEFLFALPFLFFILILTVNFGRVFLMKQRSLMAVRYVAFSDVHGQQPAPSDSQLSTMFFQGENVQSSGSAESGQPAKIQQAAATAQEQSGADLPGFFNSLSSSKRYQVKHDYHPVFAAGDYWGKGEGKWFPELTVSSSLVMDSNDWRYPQMSYWKLIRDFFKGMLGKLGGDILK